MKMNKKKIAVVSLIVCIASIASLGSLAWFSDTDTVTNTLKFVTDFEMDLYETDENGKIVVDASKNTIGQTYENLTPGATLHKDPTVINKSSTEGQYIRMTVTVSKAFEWAKLIKSGTDLTTVFTGYDKTLWTRVDEPVSDGKADTITYTYYLNDVLAAGKTATLFTGITIPSSMTSAQAKDIAESVITIKADAIQSSNLGTVSDTMAAFAVVEGKKMK